MTLGECFQTFPHPTTAAFLTLGLESFNPADIAEIFFKRYDINFENNLVQRGRTLGGAEKI